MQSTIDSTIISSDQVIGTDVYNPEGETLGSIHEVMIDKVSGQISYAVLEFGGFLGMGTDRYPILWAKMHYDTVVDGYVVPMDKDQLASAPKYHQDEEPDYDEEYGRKVSSYYGLAGY